jgi:DNA-directed RNA polymerase subunit F
VRAWHSARKLRSEQAADLEARKLSSVAEWFGKIARSKVTPAEIVRLARDEPNRIRDLSVEYAARMKAAGRQDSYISKTLSAVSGWLKHNGVEFHQFPKLSPIVGETLKTEQVPTPDELRTILSALPVRGRVIALAMAHAGLRPGVLGDYRGRGGLTLGDLAELRLSGKGAPTFDLKPGQKAIRINVAATLSKTRRAYVTFGTLELAEAILTYLRDRAIQGDKLTPTSPLVAMSPLGARNVHRSSGPAVWGHTTTKTIVFELRKAISKVRPDGVRWRPYVLRSYCSTQLWTARMDREAREAMLGHNLGVSGRYNLSKKLGNGLVDELRSEYEKAVPYLETFARQDTGSKSEEAARALLALIGVPEEEIVSIQAGSMTPEELKKLGQKYVLQRPTEPNGPVSIRPPQQQKIVPLEEANALMEKGWRLKETVGPNRDRLVLELGGSA